jgi:hypothetical protein
MKNQTVNYFGVSVEVPVQFNFLAMDANGQLWAFEQEPTLDTSPEYFGGWDDSTDSDFMPIYTDTDDEPCPFCHQSLVRV